VSEPISPAISGIDKVSITLRVNDDLLLGILMADDGSINRTGTGVLGSDDRDMYIGLSQEPLFARFMTRITPELLAHQGEFQSSTRKGATCELTIVLGYRGVDRAGGFRFVYGSESDGPPGEICALVRYAVELTTPWHEAQKRLTGAAGTRGGQDTKSIASICDHLLQDANAKAVVIVDDAGDVVARAGDAQLLTDSEVRARKTSEPVDTLHRAASGNLLVSSGHPLTIGVLFDDRSSPGLVRLRVRQARDALAAHTRS